MACAAPAEPQDQPAGRAWVDRYLEPLFKARWGEAPAPRSCLQLWADDDEEAQQLRLKGHDCVVWLPPEGRLGGVTWYQPPMVGRNRQQLPFPDASVDFVFSGAFGRLAQGLAQRERLASELSRILRPGGAMLLGVGNRWCPVDMQDHAAFVHGPWHPEKAGLGAMERCLLGAGFTDVECLSLRGHFGWSRVPRGMRPVARMIEASLAWTSHPARRWIYASPLNTMFMLWISR